MTSGRKGLFCMDSPKQSPTRWGRHGDSQGIPSAGTGSWSITLFPHTRSREQDQEVGEVANSQPAPHFSDTLLAPGSLLLLNFPQLPKQSYQPRTKCSKEPSEDISYETTTEYAQMWVYLSEPQNGACIRVCVWVCVCVSVCVFTQSLVM